MGSHRFGVGDLVRVARPSSLTATENFVDHLRGGLSGGTVGGIVEIVQMLPDLEGDPQYRVRSCADMRMHIVRETQLVPAVRPAPHPR